jgi:hypothetical protein
LKDVWVPAIKEIGVISITCWIAVGEPEEIFMSTVSDVSSWFRESALHEWLARSQRLVSPIVKVLCNPINLVANYYRVGPLLGPPF